MKLERFDAAAARLAEAAADGKNPLLPEMLYDGAVALGRAGHSPEARSAFAAMRERFPEHALAAEALAAEASLALGAGDNEGAAKLCESFLDRYPSHPRAASVQAALADAELAAGDPERAERTYGAFLKAHPDDPRAVNAAVRRGLALAKLGRTDEASEALTRSEERRVGKECR